MSMVLKKIVQLLFMSVALAVTVFIPRTIRVRWLQRVSKLCGMGEYEPQIERINRERGVETLKTPRWFGTGHLYSLRRTFYREEGFSVAMDILEHSDDARRTSNAEAAPTKSVPLKRPKAVRDTCAALSAVFLAGMLYSGYWAIWGFGVAWSSGEYLAMAISLLVTCFCLLNYCWVCLYFWCAEQGRMARPVQFIRALFASPSYFLPFLRWMSVDIG